MADWTSLLPRPEKPQSAADVYEHAAKMQQMRQTAVYNQARIAEQNALAARAQTENQQKQRALQGAQAVAEEIQKNTTYDPVTGEPKTNYVAIHKGINDRGFPELGTSVDDAAFKQLQDHVKSQQTRLGLLGQHAGSVQTPNWDDPGSVQNAGEQWVRAVNGARAGGAISEEEATQLRQMGVNYNPQVEQLRQQMIRQGIPDSLKQVETVGKIAQNLHESRMAPNQEAKAASDAAESGARATNEQLSLAGRIAGAGGYPAQSSSGFDPGQAENPYQATPMPQGAAGAQTAPQQPATPPPPAAGAPRATVPASQATPVPQPPGNVSGSRFNTNRAPVTPASQYDTPLTPQQESQFQDWKAKNAPNDSGEDYDLRGAFLADLNGTLPRDARGHTGDQFKKPNHPTFSDESQYHGKNGNAGGHWGDDGTFTPGATNLQNHSPAELQQYFKQNEPDTKLNLPGASAGKPPGWTQEKQDQLEAFRSDPAFARVARFLPKQAGNSADAVIKAYGLTREQQVTNEDREAAQGARGDKQKAAARDLGAAAEQGLPSYTRAYDKQPPEVQAMFPKPENWDPEKTPLQVRMLGMSPEEQNNAKKTPNGEKPATRVQYENVQTKKAAAQKSAFDDLQRDLKTSQYDPNAWEEAHQNYKKRIQEAQNEYEAGIGVLNGESVGHNPWADNYVPPPFPTTGKPAAKPASGGGVMQRAFGGGGAPPAQAAVPATGAPQKGETRQHNGATYTFDGQVWRRQ